MEKQKKNMVPLQELNLTSRFLYDEGTGSERIRKIHERVRKVRLSEEVGVKYMQAWEEKYYEREEGREEGRAQGREEGELLKLISQIQKKAAKGKSMEKTADELEAKVEEIADVYKAVQEFPEKTGEEILEFLKKSGEEEESVR